MKYKRYERLIFGPVVLLVLLVDKTDAQISLRECEIEIANLELQISL